MSLLDHWVIRGVSLVYLVQEEADLNPNPTEPPRWEICEPPIPPGVEAWFCVTLDSQDGDGFWDSLQFLTKDCKKWYSDNDTGAVCLDYPSIVHEPEQKAFTERVRKYCEELAA